MANNALALLDVVQKADVPAQAGMKMTQEEFKALSADIDVLRKRVAAESYMPNKDELRSIVAFFRAQRESNFVLKLPKAAKGTSVAKSAAAGVKRKPAKAKLSDADVLALFGG